MAFRAFRLFGACALFKTFLHFSTFRTFRAHPPQDFSGLFDFSWLFRLFDFSELVHFSRFFCTFQLFGLFGLIPLSPSDDTHTHILNQCYHKSTAAPNLRRPCRLRRVDLTCDSLNDVPGQPTYIRRRHLAIIFRPRALNPDLQEQCFRV